MSKSIRDERSTTNTTQVCCYIVLGFMERWAQQRHMISRGLFVVGVKFRTVVLPFFQCTPTIYYSYASKWLSRFFWPRSSNKIQNISRTPIVFVWSLHYLLIFLPLPLKIGRQILQLSKFSRIASVTWKIAKPFLIFWRSQHIIEVQSKPTTVWLVSYISWQISWQF